MEVQSRGKLFTADKMDDGFIKDEAMLSGTDRNEANRIEKGRRRA